MAKRLRYLWPLFSLVAGGLVAGVMILPRPNPIQVAHADAPAEAKKDDKVHLLPSADDAVRLALQDLDTLPASWWCCMRYIFCQDMTKESWKSGSLAVNSDGRGTQTYPLPVCGGGVLLRVDLRQMAPQSKDLQEVTTVWESLRFDPNFNALLTPDELKNLKLDWLIAHGLGPKKKTIEHHAKKNRTVRAEWPGGPDDNGHVFAKGTPYNKYEEYDEVTTETVEVPPMESADVVRLDGFAVDPVAFALLKERTGSEAPIVMDRYFELRAHETIKDAGKVNNSYADVFGGLYYEFNGVRTAKEAKAEDQSDLDVFFTDFGVGAQGSKENFDQLFGRLRSDQRAITFISGVTGKVRETVVVAEQGAANGYEPVGAITDDVRDQDIDIAKTAYKNLEKFRPAAFEGIFVKRNGFNVFGLWDGDGKRLDRAAPDVAKDKTVPDQFTDELQCGESCEACHNCQGDGGWKVVKNDELLLLEGKRHGFTALTDISRRMAVDSDTADRLAGQYLGSFEGDGVLGRFPRARLDYATVTYLATGPWPGTPQADIVKTAWTQLIGNIRTYKYGKVGAKEALADCGVYAPPDKSLDVINALLAPDPDADFGPFILEDPTIGALKEGGLVRRQTWALVQGFAAARVRKSLIRLQGAMP